MSRWPSWLLAGLISGCVSAPCTPSLGPSPAAAPTSQVTETAPPIPQALETAPIAAQAQFERGRPNRFLDVTGRILGVPRQVLLWNRRVNNHCISPTTEQIVAEYLAINDLPEVLVRVNEYAPLSEWKRLRNNRRVGAGWRYTIGAFDLLMYTLRPGRLFGGDWYNPFTDTINLYSDVPAIALHEAAYAKNIHHRRRPGTYAVVQHLPIVGMWYRTNATREALAYLEARNGAAGAQSQEADKVLYPLYGEALGGQVGQFVPIPFAGTALNLAGIGIGHAVGRYRAHQQRKKQEIEPPQQLEGGSETILPATATTTTMGPTGIVPAAASTKAGPSPPGEP
jgi:hypothetical protein